MFALNIVAILYCMEWPKKKKKINHVTKSLLTIIALLQIIKNIIYNTTIFAYSKYLLMILKNLKLN